MHLCHSIVSKSEYYRFKDTVNDRQKSYTIPTVYEYIYNYEFEMPEQSILLGLLREIPQ